MAVLNEVGGDNDLSLTQLRVLAILRDRRLGMTALAEYLGLEKSTMTGLVERAEKRGLLARVPNAVDGRVVEVRLAKKGAGLADRLYGQVRESLSSLFDGLAPAERRRLQALLERLRVGREPATAPAARRRLTPSGAGRARPRSRA